MLMESDETRSLFAESMRVWNAISAQQKDAAILFVDLAGSTEFKAVHGQYLGLQKTFIHNSLVTEAAANPGEVVKYIGDEVMIVTDAERACRLAIQIQQSFAALNQTHSGDSLFPIRSKIGIHWGPVQYWKYPNHEPLDPQG